MNEHLPECTRPYLDCDEGSCQRCDRDCICDNLRACGERVARDQYNAGHAEAIREAMQRITSLPAVVTRGPVGITEAAVIAALKDL